ncbi:hypothetical protein GPY51_01375 [Photorhabdus laumondii subsp. laumondii]|uniref:Photorhabdus luminescens subsp. laumondii TTO1 complete genome segment 10/17 n=3 Tax=Photorhabdus laumondii TaxID=2218628 RepID=Q7N3B8_PHOLL|nr:MULTISPECIES: hypothetical protein [Photorhabdus]PQQ39571.1 hypothetical protein C6H68_01125 [Photorhabdus luminescens]AWK42518.1 hypothetical protein A4R40_13960 [Photorhabdus laumondii subsp. laumondii]AXG43368.1 hypothetical protein PluDJC_14675 [Photorhabdus laumondii subsp. laumondii]AXG47840.1 hypothetical protein PluTT01m_14370 [Photorhabdus laumondii subsp. laumondii]KTL61903.1 hypothetical protein AA106_07505 [Photorhabdus laumondii subsp. laumondii]
MSGSDDKKIEFNTSDVLNALLHRGQNMQHLATQESVDNLRRETEVNFASLDKCFESIDKRFESVEKRFELIDRRFESIDKRFDVMDKRFESIDKRFDKLEGKFDRLQWFIVAAALALLFKEYIFKAAAVIQ